MVALVTKQELIMLVVGGVFVVEALSVIFQVVSFKLRRKRIFRMAPIHHHFELQGWPEPQIIVRFWIVSIICARAGAQHLETAMTLKVAGQQFLVIGAGKTGQSVARFLAALRRARASGGTHAPRHSSARTLPDGIDVRVGDTAEDLLDGIDVVIPSPGVARAHVLLRRAVGRGLPVLSEIELASRVLTCPILAVTGTNGKSTTTVLLGSDAEGGGHARVRRRQSRYAADRCLSGGAEVGSRRGRGFQLPTGMGVHVPAASGDPVEPHARPPGSLQRHSRVPARQGGAVRRAATGRRGGAEPGRPLGVGAAAQDARRSHLLRA